MRRGLICVILFVRYQLEDEVIKLMGANHVGASHVQFIFFGKNSHVQFLLTIKFETIL